MAPLANGDYRLLADLAGIDDRGLEFAEAIVHQHRQQEDRAGEVAPSTDRALLALDGVRALTRTNRAEL